MFCVEYSFIKCIIVLLYSDITNKLIDKIRYIFI